ncbi:MAG: non-ribosomal peptide synthetase, partial [Pseudomonadota bacterium]
MHRDLSDVLAAGAAALAPYRARRIFVIASDDATTATATAAVMAIATAVPGNPQLTNAEWAAQAQGADVDAVLAPAGSDRAVALAEAIGADLLWIIPRSDRCFASFDIDVAKSTAVHPRGADDIALILQTSGSTGAPKLVPHNVDGLLSSARTIADTLRLQEDDIGLHALPMFHVGAVVDLFLAPLIVGGAVRMAHPFNASGVADAVVESQATWLQAVPTMLHALTNAVDPDTLLAVGRSLRFVRSVSADLSPVLQAKVETALGGVPVIQMYGMTETAGQICTNPSPPAVGEPGSVGRPCGADLAILDALGNEIAVGKTGEVCVRGPSVMSGYLKQDNREVFFGEWFRTGDLGAIDDAGYVFLSGRRKEIINRGGEKISPLEIERVLSAVPGVAEALCAPTTHATLGEDVGDAVVLDRGSSMTAEDLQDALRAELADFKRPRKLLVLDALPKLAGGKPDRRALSDLLDGAERTNGDGPAYRTPFGPVISRLWAQSLGTEPPGPEEDFFTAGGDSLSAITFITELERSLRRPMPANLLYEAPTFGALEAAIAAIDTAPPPAAPRSGLPDAVFQAAKRGMAGWRGARRHDQSLIVQMRTVGRKAPLFFCSPTEAGFFDLSATLDPDRPFYAMRTLWLQEGASDENEKLLAAHYAAEIVDIHPDGSILLGGHCRTSASQGGP